MIYVILYLVAIVLANLSIYYFGTTFILVNAFLFIGFDLVARDKLHEKWENDKLFLKMSLLVLTGSVLSFLLASGSWQIGLASFTAFLLAGFVDTLVYQILKNKSQIVRMNGSNVPSAITDSVVFPTLAFGQFLPLVILGSAAAKIFGGLFWSYIVTRNLRRNNDNLDIV